MTESPTTRGGVHIGRADTGADHSQTTVDNSSVQTSTVDDHSVRHSTDIDNSSRVTNTHTNTTTTDRRSWWQGSITISGHALPNMALSVLGLVAIVALVVVAALFRDVPRPLPTDSAAVVTQPVGPSTEAPEVVPPRGRSRATIGAAQEPQGQTVPPPDTASRPLRVEAPQAASLVASDTQDRADMYVDGYYLSSGVGLPMLDAPTLEVAYRSALDAADIDARAAFLKFRESEIEHVATTQNRRLTLQQSERIAGVVPPSRRVKETPRAAFGASQSVEVVMRFSMFGPTGVLAPLVTAMAPQLAAHEQTLPRIADSDSGSEFDSVIFVVPASFTPTPFPRVFTSAGALVYGVRDVDPRVVQDIGLASFARSVEEARQKLQTAGAANAIVLNAGLLNTSELVVTDDVARRAVAVGRGARAFQSARVCVVIPR